MRAGIKRLTKRLEEVRSFNPAHVTDQFHSPRLTQLRSSIEEALARTFGAGTLDFARYESAAYFDVGPVNMYTDTPISAVRESLSKSRENSIALLEQAVTSLRRRLDEEEASDAPLGKRPANLASRKVFVVHGHDEGAREAVARFLEKIDFEPVILHERPNKGRTIITKFREEAAEIGFAVVLMTPDDEGGKPAAAVRSRARQNVVFELGFFIGALGPEKVVALVKGELERPSDFDGVVYIPFDEGHWRVKLGQELQAAGFEVNWNAVMKA